MNYEAKFIYTLQYITGLTPPQLRLWSHRLLTRTYERQKYTILKV